MSRRDTEDAFAYFTARLRANEFEIPLDLRAYETEAVRRAAEKLSRDAEQRWREEFDRAFYGPPPYRNAIEVITDPRDRRGFNARRIN